MDLVGLLRELSGTGISVYVAVGVALVVVRYWFSETRREISKEIDEKIGAAKNDFQQSFRELRQEIREAKTDSSQAHKETRQEINAVRVYAEQSHQETRQEMKDITLHLIDVRERLANIEGRMGIYPPRRGVEPPIPEPAAEPESGESSQS